MARKGRRFIAIRP